MNIRASVSVLTFVICCVLVNGDGSVKCYMDNSTDSLRHTADLSKLATCKNGTSCTKETWSKGSEHYALWGCEDSECHAAHTSRSGADYHKYCCKKDLCNVGISQTGYFTAISVVFVCVLRIFIKSV